MCIIAAGRGVWSIARSHVCMLALVVSPVSFLASSLSHCGPLSLLMQLAPPGYEPEQLLRASHRLQLEVPLLFPIARAFPLTLCAVLCCVCWGWGRWNRAQTLRFLTLLPSGFSFLPHQVRWLSDFQEGLPERLVSTPVPSPASNVRER